MVIPEYNYVLFNLVYNIRNNKHIIFAIWLSKIPLKGTALKLTTFNKKFGLNYKSANDFCFKFLKPIRKSLDQYNNLSFNFKCNGDLISIYPYDTSKIQSAKNPTETNNQQEVTRRLNYFKNRYGLHENQMIQFEYQYRNISQTKELIEKSFKEFIRINRMKGVRSTDFQGNAFLNEIQNHIIDLYSKTKMGQLLPEGYPVII